MSGYSGGGATAAESSSLLELLKNPDAAKQTLAALNKAQKASDEARAAAQDAQRQATMDRGTVDAKLKELAQREAAHDAAVKAFAAERDKASAVMALREHGVAYRLKQLDDGNAALNRAREVFEQDMAARQSEIAARQAALDQHIAAAETRERNLAQRRAALRQALAD